MQQNRSINSSRNALSGFLKMGIKIVLPFIIRSVMLYHLGKEYLGLNSLFSSVLNVLNIAELGFSSAVTYRLYAPVANDDRETVCAYLNYLKRIYRIIGTVVCVSGILFLPFLKFIAKGGYPSDINIHVLFIIYLFNTGISYFFSGYKRTIIIASQRMDYINLIETILFSSQYILQIAAIVLFHNYYLYIILLPITTILINVFISWLSYKRYSCYFGNSELSDKNKAQMRSDVKGVAIYKISETTRNSFDSIVISAGIGLIAVGIYNNYYYIFSAVYSIMVIINQSLQPSIGNSIAIESKSKNENDLYVLTLFSLWLIIFSSASLLCLYQPFMSLWVGNDMLLSNYEMSLFCIYFYILNMSNIRNLYYDGNGLWLKGKYSFIIESLGNLLLNILLGYFWGIKGVLFATIVTMFLCSFLWRSYILFKEYFGISGLKKYLLFHLRLMFIGVIICMACYYCCKAVTLHGVFGIISSLCICIFIPNIMLYFIYHNNIYFIDGKKKILYLMKNRQ